MDMIGQLPTVRLAPAPASVSICASISLRRSEMFPAPSFLFPGLSPAFMRNRRRRKSNPRVLCSSDARTGIQRQASFPSLRKPRCSTCHPLLCNCTRGVRISRLWVPLESPFESRFTSPTQDLRTRPTRKGTAVQFTCGVSSAPSGQQPLSVASQPGS